ncbi:MAG: hypothetical protein JO211_00340 [Acidobacteriaceae bacterium]|nr:hypothetical protein [Acidobacteriaceae bacterium]
MPLSLPKYSLGVGDRFAQQGKAQLQACVMAAERGVTVIPVWNKSNREHTIIGSDPCSTRKEADEAVRALNWQLPYFVDADHIGLDTMERFVEPCDFFTIDVADQIGNPAHASSVEKLLKGHPELLGNLSIPGVRRRFETSRDCLQRIANKFLRAIEEAARIYHKIEDRKGAGNFIPEVSIDETDSPQTPVELLVILAAIADHGIPIQTIAPRFTGRFNKGIDYVGNLEEFRTQFRDDIAGIAYAVERYGLPKNLKLSVHSGSDKFSIYGPIREAMKEFDAGIHLKTAGTTWLEELIGLAEAGGDGLELAKEIYSEAYSHLDELCAPYAAVIDIDPAKLPTPEELKHWSSQQFVSALRHDPRNPTYNSSIRQLLHVGFKVAAKMGDRYIRLLRSVEETVAKNVTANLFKRHIEPLFLGA